MIENARPKITIIGPMLPFRGGIAQYTTQLFQALQPHADVQAISFKRLYPAWLYPGKSDELRLTARSQREPDVRYLIDAYNPFSLRRASRQIIETGCDLVVIDWWTLFWWPGLAYLARRLRKRGIKTAFLCHNLFNHKTGGFMGFVDKLMYGASKIMLRQASAYIVQSSEQRELLEHIKPGAAILQRLHPIYTRFPTAKKSAPRGRLELLFFGVIRPYKGLDTLLSALEQLQDQALYVTIVGEPWGDAQALEQQIKTRRIPHVETRLEYVSDQETAEYVARADALVLPYRSATGSGVVAVAYHYGKPAIATRVGGLREAVIDGRTGILVAPDSPDALADAIRKLDRQQLAAMRPAIERFCQENSWDAMARAIVDFSRHVTS